jgi:hypothetical protein
MTTWDILYSEARPPHLRPPLVPEPDSAVKAVLEQYAATNAKYSRLINTRDLIIELDASRDRFIDTLRGIDKDWTSTPPTNEQASWSPRQVTEHLAFSEGAVLWIACSSIGIEVPYLLTYLPNFETKDQGIEGVIAMGETCAPVYSQITDLDLRKPVESPFGILWEQTVWGVLVRNISQADEHAARIGEFD